MSAINLALLELTSKRSDMVITGGVDVLSDIFMHMCFAKTQILSPTRKTTYTCLPSVAGVLEA